MGIVGTSSIPPWFLDIYSHIPHRALYLNSHLHPYHFVGALVATPFVARYLDKKFKK
jgi:hypothetical protein